MYLINITIKGDKIPEDKRDELLQGHRAWFTKEFDEGNFLLVGPYKDKGMAGVTLAQAESREEVEATVARDVFYPDLATYEISEFQANLIADNLSDYRGK